MLNMIFEYGGKPVLIKRISIGFGAILKIIIQTANSLTAQSLSDGPNYS